MNLDITESIVTPCLTQILLNEFLSSEGMNVRTATSFSSLSCFLSAISDNVILGIYCRTLAAATFIVTTAHIDLKIFIGAIAYNDYITYNTCIGGQLCTSVKSPKHWCC